MRVIWARNALLRLFKVQDRINRDEPEAANWMVDQIYATVSRLAEFVSRLAEFPRLGREADRPGIRKLAIPDTPFIVTYRVKRDEVIVLRLSHGRRKES